MTTARLNAALGTIERVLVDTSAMIAFHSTQESVHALAKHVMQRIEDSADPLRGYYSAVSATEIMVRPIQTSMADFTYMHTFLTGFPNLTILSVDIQVATQAANIRALTGIPTPDAMIVAAGMLVGCGAIVCNDKRWKARLAPLFSAFTWVYLGDYL